MHFVLTVVTILVLGISCFGRSFPSTPHHAYNHIEVVTSDGVILKGVNLSNPRAPKVLLQHGFGENTRIFRELANLLHSLGYDVYMFNFRGHGNGSQLSHHPDLSKTTRTGFYGFDNWVTKDIPAILEFLTKDKSKIEVLGHSLGGAALRLYLSGIRSMAQKEGEKVFRTTDHRKLFKFAKYVEALYNVGSPTDFSSDSNLKLIMWSKLPGFLQKMAFKIFNMNKETWAEKNGIQTTEVLQETLHRTIYLAGGYRGLVGPNMNMSTAEMARMFRKAFTYEIPQDLIEDVIRWIEKGFESRSGQSFKTLTLPAALRYVHVVGVNDALAPAENVMRDTIQGRHHHTPEMIVMKTHEHLDLISGENGAARVAALVSESFAGKKARFVGMTRKVLAMPMRCSLYFSH